MALNRSQGWGDLVLGFALGLVGAFVVIAAAN